MKRTQAAAALAIVLGIATAPAIATACTCTGDPACEEALLESAAVFRGTVIMIRPAGPDHYHQVWVTLLADAWWKGEPSAVVDVLTEENEAMCGYPFELETEYLVYAMRSSQEPMPLYTHLCSRTHVSWPEDPDLVDLGPPVALPATDGSWGRLKALYGAGE